MLYQFLLLFSLFFVARFYEGGDVLCPLVVCVFIKNVCAREAHSSYQLFFLTFFFSQNVLLQL